MAPGADGQEGRSGRWGLGHMAPGQMEGKADGAWVTWRLWHMGRKEDRVDGARGTCRLGTCCLVQMGGQEDRQMGPGAHGA